MLVTVNGEADNGKDLVADWICQKFDLVKIALADPMKRFCRQFFGFPFENLWGPSHKRNEELDAGPLWRMAFSQLHTMHQFTSAVVIEDYGVEARVRAFTGLQDWFTALRRANPDRLSARTTLQTLGTEWGRTVDDELWIKYLFNLQLPRLAMGYPYVPELGVRTNLEPQTPKHGLCIPDQRFQNELDTSRNRGGYSIRVRRLSRVRNDNTNVGIAGHKSELEQRGIPDSAFDKVFEFPEGLDTVYAMLEDWASQIKDATTVSL